MGLEGVGQGSPGMAEAFPLPAELQPLVRLLGASDRPRPPVVEAGVAADGPLTPAAVLFPLVCRPEGVSVLLTLRSAHLKDHPGQISFPGGRWEPEDGSPHQTALREAREEVGLDPAQVRLFGCLPEYRTSTGFRVTPVVGALRPPLDLVPDPFEVAEIFEVPLAFLLDPANRQRHRVQWQGREREYFALPYGKYFIWGATAGMILSLAQLLEEGDARP